MLDVRSVGSKLVKGYYNSMNGYVAVLILEHL